MFWYGMILIKKGYTCRKKLFVKLTNEITGSTKLPFMYDVNIQVGLLEKYVFPWSWPILNQYVTHKRTKKTKYSSNFQISPPNPNISQEKAFKFPSFFPTIVEYYKKNPFSLPTILTCRPYTTLQKSTQKQFSFKLLLNDCNMYVWHIFICSYLQ